ncbi:HK97-gp10 family putative phage morphogenesis protein [Pediococcus acidilactici]|uniref:HK97-gp10 family putative phage morphogenesis protein n=1 Tax=Pediococcus acidilactici TaxID=1254 RepID=UPI0013136ABC|nr:HK97-gp10 family putative phage morphogenesis protein [Pediococcus acidilactici]KAF0341454.1 HK97 gp10 family phage protein [Pediococcus acidilactici]KAF0352983.1 HK97 gp10 family phage protein [Pediococcus acidilactici]KAF0356790.1 HK97 gp10 family phage protein [Pediococcus acidilactici]KAF0359448.1 HK97 gp10 family phage protein [Pediococcus acidilactici]KAF0376861.1 HK97 gp10 family phage protein [Pediococcus acidilactici]
MANDDMADQLEKWLKDVHKLVPDEAEQERITKAGAKKLADNLTETTRKKHYSSHKDEKYGHMADNISYNSNDIDGEHDGSSIVGWTNKYHDMNAMRLNDGTKHIKADHFVDQNLADSQDDVFNAMLDEYKKGDDD